MLKVCNFIYLIIFSDLSIYLFIYFRYQHGADASKKNRDGSTPLDLVREVDQDVADLLRGNSALLDAAKKGNLARVQRLVTPENINCRDAQVNA